MTKKATELIKTKRIIKYIKNNKKFAKCYEKSWLKELVIEMDLRAKYFDSVRFLVKLKNKKKTSNKKQSGFFIKIFQELGCSYAKLYKQKFTS